MGMVPMNAAELNEEDGRKFDYFFMEACRLKMKGDYQKSAEMFQNCIKVDNSSAVSHFELGKILLLGGDQQNGVLLLRQAVLLNQDNEWYQVFLANVFVKTKQLHQAIEVFNNLIENNPSASEYYYNIGDLYVQTNQYDKAIAIYDKVEDLEGVNEALILEKQRLHLLAGDEKGALKEIMRLVDKYPTQSRYLILLGDYYVNVKNYKKARKTFDKVEAIDPESGFLHMSLANYFEQNSKYSESQKELALAFGSLDISYEQKMQILLNYMMHAEKDPRAKVSVETLTAILKDVHPNEANTYFFYGNFIINDTVRIDEAIINIEKSVSLDASNSDAWMQLIQIAFGKQDFDKVVSYSEDAIQGGVQTAHLYFYRGIAFQQLDEQVQAKTAYIEANDLADANQPIKAQILGSLGDVYYTLEEQEAAYSAYDEALLIDPHNVMVLNNYAYYLSENDSALDKAETMSAKCIELEPGNATYLDTYAWILYLRENLVLAKFYMEKAIHLMGESNDVLLDHYADILWANDDKEEARIYWTKALELGGDATLLTEKINRD